jgi:osmotically-inducible protein OsmY
MFSMIVPAKPNAAAQLTVEALAENRLRASPYPSIRRIFCLYDEGLLVLSGRVPSFFHKQLAQIAVADIEGVKQVINQIEVLERAP